MKFISYIVNEFSTWKFSGYLHLCLAISSTNEIWINVLSKPISWLVSVSMHLRTVAQCCTLDLSCFPFQAVFFLLNITSYPLQLAWARKVLFLLKKIFAVRLISNQMKCESGAFAFRMCVFHCWKYVQMVYGMCFVQLQHAHNASKTPKISPIKMCSICVSGAKIVLPQIQCGLGGSKMIGLYVYEVRSYQKRTLRVYFKIQIVNGVTFVTYKILTIPV